MNGVQSAFERLLSEMEPTVRAAFVRALDRIKTNAELRDLERTIERQDIPALLDALNLSPEYFREVNDAVDAVFLAGGQFQVSLAASVSSIPFNRRHLQAEAWARENGARLIAEIAETTRAGVREFVTEGIANGRPSAVIARQVVGKLNRATGRREGGIVGLTERQADFVINARRELVELDVGYFQRQARDRRFDRTVRKAIREGKPLPAATLDKIVGGYSDGLLVGRGDIIARTEAHRALNSGRYEAMRQNAENVGVSVTSITVKWQSVRDGRTRDTHRGLSGKTAQYGTPFQSSSGALMRFPGDREYGAPARETVHCRCTVTFDLGPA